MNAVLPKPPILVRGLWGLGDNIYQRPFIRAATMQYEIWLDTPWPEIYADIDIRFVRVPRRLRTQMKNVMQQRAGRWSPLPPAKRVRQITLGYANLAVQSIIECMETQWSTLNVNFDPALFDLPDMGPSPIKTERPIAVVRVVTVRREWRNTARNPRFEYVNALAADLMLSHHVIAIADLAANEETQVGQLPPAHQYFVHGQLPVRELLALVRDADLVVGGAGWIVPAGIALKTKTFVMLGGHGGHNAPAKITDPRLDLRHLGFAMPEAFCQCTSMLHDCDKTIADPLGQFRRWATTAGIHHAAA